VRPLSLASASLLLSGLAAIFFACEDDPHKRTSPDQALASGGACDAPPGQLPAPNCDNSDKDCKPEPGCTIDEARCGSKATCLPMADNTGKDVLDFRIRRLNIATPATLASDFIQNTIVTHNIDLDDKACGEIGVGLFTWLLRFDTKQNTLTTGGAPPSSDPLGKGYCFAKFQLGSNQVEPITSATVTEDGKIHTTDDRNVRIPIFLSDSLASVVLLPISNVQLRDVTITADNNCIGQFNESALQSNCYDDRQVCLKWITAGSLGGYITLEDADTVKIREIGYKSLCSFLAGATELACPRDENGKIEYQGDYCSTDRTPGSCADSVWLAGTFAASAVKIYDGQGVDEACSGAVAPVDAGSDAQPSDAAKTD
jgi:hypothetical protein